MSSLRQYTFVTSNFLLTSVVTNCGFQNTFVLIVLRSCVLVFIIFSFIRYLWQYIGAEGVCKSGKNPIDLIHHFRSKMANKQLALLFVIYSVISPSSATPVEGGCSIKLFDGRDFKGQWEETSRAGGIPRFDVHEESIQTFGRCCWRIFSEYGHRGISKILRGNRDFPGSEMWSWGPGQTKSVKKCSSCRKCSRRTQRGKRHVIQNTNKPQI